MWSDRLSDRESVLPVIPQSASSLFGDLLGALAAFSLVLLHIAAFAVLAVGLLRRTRVRVPSEFGIGGLMGLGFTGLFVWLVGHLGLLRPWTLLASAGLAATVLAVWAARAWRYDAAAVSGAWRDGAWVERLLWLMSAGMVGLIVVSGIRPPWARDELDYHWASPLFWAAAGAWETSPHRLSNGPALAQMTYTLSAVFGSPTAAHWTHTLAALCLVVTAAATARRCGGSPAAAAAGCLSMPVLVNQASIAYTDVFAAAFVLGAFAVLVDRPGVPPARLLVAGLLLAFAASVKAFTAVAYLPAILLVIVTAARTARTAASSHKLLRASRAAAVLVLPGLVLAALWLLHTSALTGQWLDRSGQYIARSPDDPMLLTGAAAGRIPGWRDVAFLPLVPAYATVLGQSEPYGGRIGLIAVPFLPLGLWAIGRLPRLRRRRVAGLALAACVYFVVLAPFLIKTRFSIFVWVVLVVVAAVGLKATLDLARSRPRLSAGVGVLFALLVLAGMADSARVLVRDLDRAWLPAGGPPITVSLPPDAGSPTAPGGRRG